MPKIRVLTSFYRSFCIVLYESFMHLNMFCLDFLLEMRKILKPYSDNFSTFKIEMYVLLGYLNFLHYLVIAQ